MSLGSTSDEIGSLIDRAYIAQDWNKTARTIRNWERLGILPAPDAVLNGLAYWRQSSYVKWKADALAGRFVGPDRMAHLRPGALSRGAA